MAAIFISYRRTDGAQAARVYESLVRRFGTDAVYMDVANIPFGADFADHLRQAISGSAVALVLIGSDWCARLQQVDDPVRMEIETILGRGIGLLPVLIGSTRMPGTIDLPPTIQALAHQNALAVGTLLDFDRDMRRVTERVEAILNQSSVDSISADSSLIMRCCELITQQLRTRSLMYGDDTAGMLNRHWRTIGAGDFMELDAQGVTVGTLYLHRISRVANALELHFILSFWTRESQSEHAMAGWVMMEMDRMANQLANPASASVFVPRSGSDGPVLEEVRQPIDLELKPYRLRVRRSDEDARQIWKLITDRPLRLSIAYVAMVSLPESTADGPVTGRDTQRASI
jgi:hypothetical protein